MNLKENVKLSKPCILNLPNWDKMLQLEPKIRKWNNSSVGVSHYTLSLRTEIRFKNAIPKFKTQHWMGGGA
jgi:hypothetical protein